MSTVPSNIAGSVSQAALQQSQVARARDAARNQEEQNSLRMRQLLEQHMRSVEDAYEADDEPMTIREEDRNRSNGRRNKRPKQPAQAETPEVASSTPASAAPPVADKEGGQLDIQA